MSKWVEVLQGKIRLSRRGPAGRGGGADRRRPGRRSGRGAEIAAESIGSGAAKRAVEALAQIARGGLMRVTNSGPAHRRRKPSCTAEGGLRRGLQRREGQQPMLHHGRLSLFDGHGRDSAAQGSAPEPLSISSGIGTPHEGLATGLRGM